MSSTFHGIDDADFDLEGDLLLLEKLLNDDPSSPLPPKELHFEEIKTITSSIDDPPELKLKELPSHLEYTFLEGTDKLPGIISKELKVEEKTALLKVIKKEVIKHLDAELIYPISDSPWVSPVHYVPKKGGMTVVENEDNELNPTRLVTGWRVCIDYRKLNDATLKTISRCHLWTKCSKDSQEMNSMFKRCMMAIFHNMIEETMEVFMYDFSVFEDLSRHASPI
ncbi:hypothetical protein Tco_0001632 [Tanacetum coccineum]